MAWAQIPPAGQMHRDEVNRQRRILEQTTLDPVLRWKLREERITDNLLSVSSAAVREARTNKITYDILRGVK